MNSTGVSVTSISCSGTCLIFSIPRQPNVSDADERARARRARAVERERLAQRRPRRRPRCRRRASSGPCSCRLPPPVSSSWSSAVWPVSARKTSSRLGWPSEKSAIAMPARDSSATASAARSPSPHGADSAAGSASRWTASSSRASTRSASSRWSGSSSRTCSAPEPTDALSCAGRALGDHLAVVDHGDPVGELVGLVEVLRAEQDRRALGDERADDVPDLVARARVEPGRRLVEEHQLRRHDDARGDVEPAAHAARVVLDEPAGRVREPERLEQLGRALLRVGAPAAEQARRAGSGSRAGQVLVDRRELAGQADEAAHRVGLAHDVVAEHARGARVGR